MVLHEDFENKMGDQICNEEVLKCVREGKKIIEMYYLLKRQNKKTQ